MKHSIPVFERALRWSVSSTGRFHALTHYLFKLHFNIILPSTLRYSK
jgi:hypothetical protein